MSSKVFVVTAWLATFACVGWLPGTAGCSKVLGIPDTSLADRDAGPDGDGGEVETPDGGADPGLTTFRKTIAIAPPAPLAADLTDIPIAIILPEDPDLAASARADGADIAFTADGAATALSHEIEQFVPATGALVAWVRVPRVARTGTTRIHIHYGDPDVTATPDVAGTWAVGFRGVWHVTERPVDGFTSEYPDSTGNLNHGRASGNERPTVRAGVAGPAVEFAGNNNEEIRIGDPGDGALDPVQSSFSFSVWVRVTTSAGNKDLPFYNGGFNASSGQNGYDFELGQNNWNVRLADGSREAEITVGQEQAFLGRWVHLVGVVDRAADQLRAFVDGDMANGIAGIGSFGAIRPSVEARIGDQTNPFRGLVDEVRVYSTALSPDRVRIEHLNLSDPAALYTVGAQEPAPYPAR